MKKFLICACFRWHILRSYCLVVEVTFKCSINVAMGFTWALGITKKKLSNFFPEFFMLVVCDFYIYLPVYLKVLFSVIMIYLCSGFLAPSNYNYK